MSAGRPYAEVIGDPVAHSKSPLIHGFWLKKLGIDAEYCATQVTTEDLPGYFASRTADSAWRGCNITIPHKLATLDHAADPGDIRGHIGAANTVFRSEAGTPTLTNTDAAGFFLPLMQVPLEGERAIVVGSGGAAHAVLFALAQSDIGSVTMLARNPFKAMALLQRFGLKGEALPMDSVLPPAALLVNASSLGMTARPEFAPDLSPLPPHAIVYDVVYAPLETKLLRLAVARGLATIDGLEMLVGQAAIAFELLFGVAPPREHDEELRQRLIA